MNTELVETDSRFGTWIKQNSKTTALTISQYTVPEKHCDVQTAHIESLPKCENLKSAEQKPATVSPSA